MKNDAGNGEQLKISETAEDYGWPMRRPDSLFCLKLGRAVQIRGASRLNVPEWHEIRLNTLNTPRPGTRYDTLATNQGTISSIVFSRLIQGNVKILTGDHKTR